MWEGAFDKGKHTFANTPIFMIIPTRGKAAMTVTCPSREKVECPHCSRKFFVKCGNEFQVEHPTGFHPAVVEGWKRMIRPMNTPVIEAIIPFKEVGDAYNTGIEVLLRSKELRQFQIVATAEDDMILPFIPNSHGPLMELLKHMGDFDAISALYHTKGEPSYPLAFGDGTWQGPNPFRLNTSWVKLKRPKVVEVNGMGMGFALFKRHLFTDRRIARPWFRTVSENDAQGSKGYTQDLWFFEKAKKVKGRPKYRFGVYTGVRCGHIDISTGAVY